MATRAENRDSFPAGPSQPVSTQPGTRWAKWGKRAGTIAFLFFFVKGLAWLVVPVALAAWWAR